jgi:5-methylcytosine-specific restriction endonuclease McrA
MPRSKKKGFTPTRPPIQAEAVGVDLPVIRPERSRRRPKISRRLRAAVYKRDKDTCRYCRRKLEAHERTLDHFKPRAQGGEDTYENLLTSCASCNHDKAADTDQPRPRPVA